MQELIKVEKRNGQRVVSGRELHGFLESKQQFGNWIANRIKRYGFIEGQDFEVINSFIKNPGAGRPTIEYAFSLDMAKELSMVEGTDKGKQARRYFIERDKQLTDLSSNRAPLAIEAHISRPVQLDNSKAVNSQRFLLGGQQEVADYNRENCKRVTGQTPTQLKEWAKRAGLPSKQRTSGKEVVRAVRPELACRMSVNDSLVALGVSLNEACDLSAGTIPLFTKMLQLGTKPAELAR